MRKIYTTVMAIGMMALPFAVSAQVSVLGNNGIPSNYVGWNAAQTFPLQIRHNGNQPIDFITDNTHRLRIMPSGTTTVNNYPIDHDGFVGLSTNPNFFNLVEPFSLLHLNGQAMDRPGPNNSAIDLGCAKASYSPKTVT